MDELKISHVDRIKLAGAWYSPRQACNDPRFDT